MKDFHVVLEICPDFEIGLTEIESYTISAESEEIARLSAAALAMDAWDVPYENICSIRVGCGEKL